MMRGQTIFAQAPDTTMSNNTTTSRNDRRPNVFSSLLHRMNPRSCLQGSYCGIGRNCSSSNTKNRSSMATVVGDDDEFTYYVYRKNPELDFNVPKLLEDIQAPDFCTTTKAFHTTGNGNDEYINTQNGGHENNKFHGGSIMTFDAALQRRLFALKKIFELTRKKTHLRIALVCTSEWNITLLLAQCLTINNTHTTTKSSSAAIDECRRIACLALNNLSIPYENKAVMIFGHESHMFIEYLLQVIRARLPESYLCCICLMNLSYLEDAVDYLIKFVVPSTSREPPLTTQQPSSLPATIHTTSNPSTYPPATKIKRFHSGRKTIKPKDWDNFSTLSRQPSSGTFQQQQQNNPNNSLLEIIEGMMQDYKPFLMSEITSVEGEAIRWSIGLLRNLTRSNAHCEIIAQTSIPSLLTSILHDRLGLGLDIKSWREDSLEELTLLVLSRLPCCEDGKVALMNCNTVDVVRPIIDGSCVGIHGTRANSILLSMGIS